MKHPDMGKIRGGQRLEAGGCGTAVSLPTGFLGLGPGQALPLGSGWQPGPDLLARAVGFYLDGVYWAAPGTQAQVGVAPLGFTARLRWERPPALQISACFARRLVTGRGGETMGCLL